MANISGTSGNDTLIGTEGNDSIDGGDGNDSIDGGDGNDSIDGGAGNDTLLGGNGDDTLLGSAGGDFLVGGAGNDYIDGGVVLDRNGYIDVNTVSYQGGPGIVADLSGITGDGSTGFGTVNDGMGGTDTLVNVQFIRGSDNNDTITGSSALIFEQIEGGDGDDVLDGGVITDAATNSNRLSYQSAGAAVGVDLELGQASGATTGDDTIANFNRVRGSNFDDTLLGSGANEMFEGRGGNDTIDGRGGFDTVRYDQAPTTTGISVWLGGNIAFSDGQGGSDTLNNIEAVRGTNWNDVIYGDDANNLLEGMGGNDHIYGGLGNDTLAGGDGWDTVSYETNSSGNEGFWGTTGAVYVNLANNTASGADGDDVLSGFEAVVGSDFNDTIIGDNNDNDFEGRGGNDSIDGGGGFDRVTFWSASAGVTVNLATGRTSGVAGIDTLVGIEGVVGSTHDDHLVGSTNDVFEMFEGGKGDDTIDGGAITTANNGNRASYQSAAGSVTVDLQAGTAIGADGNDTLININQVRGSNHNDTLTGSNTTTVTEFFEGRGGSNYIDGKGGTDVVRFDAAWTGVVVNLADGRAHNNGQGGVDTLAGIEGIQGTRFDDVLLGGHAQGGVFLEDGLIEFFRGGAGNDTIDGGQGYDRADYDTSTSGVQVDLGTNTAQDGLGGTDTLYNIEAVRGSSNNDTLIGSDAYFESFEGGAGNDTIDGKGGWDRVDYRYLATTGVNVNLAGNTASDGQGGTDTLYNIEMARGSNFNDTLVGDSGNNKLEGMGGNDSIVGGDGDDTMEGGEGNDTMLGGDGNDELRGGNGNDSVDGGAGNDNIQGGAGNDTLNGGDGWDWVNYGDATAAVNVNLQSGTATGGGGSDKLSGFEAVAGSNFNDTLTGDSSNNDFDGGRGNDRIVGGGGFDRVGYWSAEAAVNVNLATGQAIGAETGTDTLVNISGAVGSRFSDTLTGNGADNTFEGGEGNDIIDGGAGNDWLHGGAGNDTLLGGAGSDVLIGGGGNDSIDGGVITDRNGYTDSNTLSYEFDIAGITMDLSGITGDGSEGSGTVTDGWGGTDTVSNVNFIRGSAHADSILGSAADIFEMFEGGAGNDTMNGGAMTVDEGVVTNSNRVSYQNAGAAVTVNLEDGTATGAATGTDTLSNFNQARGSSHGDSLVGSNAAYTELFEGRGGNDTIDGAGGFDIVRYDLAPVTTGVNVDLADNTASDGQGGTDTLYHVEGVYGSSFADTINGNADNNILEGRDGNDSISGGDGNDTLRGDNGNDTLLGGAGDDRLEGGAGDDRLDGGTGTDTLIGGDGNDTAVLNAAFSAYTITKVGTSPSSSLRLEYDGNVTFVHESVENLAFSDGTRTLASIMQTTGGDGNDSLTGTTGNDSLYGLGGNDTLNGLAGNDYLDGGEGNDSMVGGAGNDTYVIDSESDTVVELANGGTDLVNVNLSSGVYTLHANVENATVTSAEAVHLTGNALANVLTGNDQANLLDGGAGNDTLIGGGGDDTLVGGAGTDRMVGGTGDDTYVIDVATEAVVEQANEGTDTVQVAFATATTYTLALNVENAEIASSNPTLGIGLTGNDLDNVLTGNAGNNTLNGGKGNDTIAGGGGTDAVDGGEGSDVLVLQGTRAQYEVTRATNDTLVLTRAGAIPEKVTLRNIESVMFSDETATLADLLENSISDFNDIWQGTPGDDTKDGLKGDDSMSGLAGNDSLTGGLGNDTLDGGEGNDTLDGGAGNDSLMGGVGNDSLVGGVGNDTMAGGEGNDIYVVDSLLDVVTEEVDEGTDLVNVALASGTYQLTANVENAEVTSTGAVGIMGNGENNYLKGNAAANTLKGEAGNDSLEGMAGNDILEGGDGNDTLDGGLGNDKLLGGAGDDLLITGGGNDTVDGGDGNDTLELAGNRVDWVLARTATGTQFKRGAETVTFSNIDSVKFGDQTVSTSALLDRLETEQKDTLVGDGSDDILNGKGGNDVIYGHGGNDSLLGGAGNDTLEGGEGNDTLDGGAGIDSMIGGAGNDTYVVDVAGDVVTEDADEGTDLVNVALASGTYQLTANVENATVTHATGAVNLTGNALDNHLIGNKGANKLLGGLGNDSLDGGLGNDILEGGDGNDTLNGGLGNDKLLGGAGDDRLITGGGNDTVDGGEGNDTLELAGNRADWVLSRTTAGTQFKRGTEIVTFSNIESVKFEDETVSTSELLDRLASTFNDTLVGDGTDNVLDGLAGNDVIYGHGGNDSLLGGAGNDTLDGGAGNDTLDGGLGNDAMAGGDGADVYVVDAAGDVVTEQSDEGTDLVNVALASGTYQLTANVENATVTHATGAVNLTGNELDNHLIGNKGANKLLGGVGNDSLEGGLGNDILEGGEGNDTLDGGVGNDKLLGGAGDDRLITGGGSDTVDGGEGADTLVLAGDRDAWTLSRTSTGTQFKRGVETVTFSNIESVEFDDGLKTAAELLDTWATDFNDTLKGDDGGNDSLDGGKGNDVIYGYAGNDTLIGGLGNDTLDGGEGDDSMEGGAGNDTYVVDSEDDVVVELLNGGTDLVQVEFASAGTYTLADNVEQATVTSSAAVDLTGNGLANVLTGNDEANVLSGMAGNDTLVGGGGDDTLDGGDGNDRMSGGLGDDTYLVNVAGDVVVELADQGDNDLVEVNFAANGTYVLSANVENGTITTVGTVLKVNLTGNASDNVLTGNGGANVLSGGLGDDTLIGGLGNDTLDGGAGDDVAMFDEHVDDWDVVRTSATDFKVTHKTTSQIVIVRNVEQLQFNGDPSVPIGNITTGTAFADVLYASETGQPIDGMAGNDTIYGGTGNDTLIGGTGTDSLIGGAGDDTYEVDVAGDKIVELAGGGTDHVKVNLASGTYILSAHVENATVTSVKAVGITGNDLDNVLTGNALANTLTGGAGNDTLDGGLGNDRLVGGLGDDTYIVNVAGDVVTEALNQGTDTVQVAFAADGTYVLSANVERGIITTANTDLKVNLTGSSGANELQGNAGDNVLNGMGGNDTLAGGLGTDTLTGGAGADTFVFDTALSLANVDTITDFNTSQGDKLALSVSIFTALGSVDDPVDLGGDYLKYDASTGALTYDADGIGDGDAMTIAILGTSTQPALTAGDLLLIA